MDHRANAYVRHQQTHWLKHDAARWVRPDAARFLKPGTRVEDVYPALAKKYNPSQPRVLGGSGRESGQWTSGGARAEGRPRVIIDTTEFGNEAESGTTSDQSSGAPIDDSRILSDADPDPIELGAQYAQAGDPPRGIGDNKGPPLEDPPEIPKERTSKSSQTTAILRSAALWMGRALRLGVAIDVLVRSFDKADWIQERRAEAEPISIRRDRCKSSAMRSMNRVQEPRNITSLSKRRLRNWVLDQMLSMRPKTWFAFRR